MSLHRSAATIVLALLLLGGCGGSSTSSEAGIPHGEYAVPEVPADFPGAPPPVGGIPPGLQGGVMLTITSDNKPWRWWVTNPVTAQHLAEVWEGTRSIFSLGGVLRDGPGKSSYNAPWSWHVDPEDNGLDILTVPEAPHTVEQCERQLAFWLSQGVVFIPSDWRITAFEDRRTLNTDPPQAR